MCNDIIYMHFYYPKHLFGYRIIRSRFAHMTLVTINCSIRKEWLVLECFDYNPTLRGGICIWHYYFTVIISIETSTSTSLIPPATTITISNSASNLDSSHDAPITARYSTITRDIEHALKQSPLLGKRGEMKSKSSVNIIYGLAGTVLQVEGLKGDLSKCYVVTMVTVVIVPFR